MVAVVDGPGNAACTWGLMPFWQQCQTFTQTNLPELGARRALIALIAHRDYDAFSVFSGKLCA